MLTNTNEGAGAVIKVTREALTLAWELKTGQRRRVVPTSPVATLSAERLVAMEGYYASPQGLVVISRRGERLKLKIGGVNFDFIPYEDGRFSLRLRLFGLIPLNIEALNALSFTSEEFKGRQVIAMYYHGIMLGTMAQFEPVAVPNVWQARSGKYEPLEAESFAFADDFRLIHDKRRGLLFLRMKILGAKISLPLRPLSDTEAVVFGEGRNMGETLRVVPDGDGERLIYSGIALTRKGR